MTSVVIADDRDLVRSGLRMVLEARGIDVLGEAADGRQAVELVTRTSPDVVLMEVHRRRRAAETPPGAVADRLPCRHTVSGTLRCATATSNSATSRICTPISVVADTRRSTAASRPADSASRLS